MSILVICGVMIGVHLLCHHGHRGDLCSRTPTSSTSTTGPWAASSGVYLGAMWQVAAVVVGVALTLAASFCLSKPIGGLPAGGRCTPRSVGVGGAGPFSMALVLLSSCAGGLRHGLCRADLLCGHRGAPPRQGSTGQRQTLARPAGLLRWAGRRSACSVTSSPAACLPLLSCPSARLRPCSAHRWSSGC